MKMQIKLYENLLDALREKVPKKSELVKIVTDTLHIEKESAYRRLRGEIPFTLDEAGIIAARMEISMDRLISKNHRDGADRGHVAISLHTGLGDYDYSSLGKIVEMYEKISYEEDSECGMAMNSIPPIFYMRHPYLRRLFLFKWSQRYDNDESHSYHEFRANDKLWEMQDRLNKSYGRVQRVSCVIDQTIIRSVITDINYYRTVKLLRPEDVEHIVQDLYDLINEMEYIGNHGKLPGGNGIFELCLSDISIGTSYQYLCGGKNNCISSITTFVIQSAISNQQDAYLKIKTWVHYLRRMSTLISIVGSKERVEFLERQRELVASLI